MTRTPETMDAATEEVLRARAARYAHAPLSQAVSRNLGDFVGCRISGQAIGLPIGVVEEFAPLAGFTPLPGIDGVLGATQLRGEILAVVDLGKLLLGRSSASGNFVLVLGGSTGRTSAIVDEILGQRTLFESDLLPESQFSLPGPLFFGLSRELWALADSSRFIRALDHTGRPDRQEP